MENARQSRFAILFPVPLKTADGPGKWTAVRRLRDLIEIPAEIAEWASSFVPDCGFFLVELSGVQWDKLADGCLARAVMGALQSERTGEMKFQEVQRIVGDLFAEPQREEALKIANHLWRYLLQHSELQSREVCEIVDSTIPAEQKEKFMSTADILRQEGRQEGGILAQQQAVVEALEIRFDRVPDGLREEIGHIVDSARLHALHRAAMGVTNDSDEFCAGNLAGEFHASDNFIIQNISGDAGVEDTTKALVENDLT